MIDVTSVMHAALTIISSNSTVVNCGFKVDLHEAFNFDPNRTPWVGIYNQGIALEPYRANTTLPWMARYDIRVYVQAHSFTSGQTANDLLHKSLKVVLDALNGNRSLDGTVLKITGWDIVPFLREIEEGDWLFTDEITIRAEQYA